MTRGRLLYTPGARPIPTVPCTVSVTNAARRGIAELSDADVAAYNQFVADAVKYGTPDLSEKLVGTSNTYSFYLKRRRIVFEVVRDRKAGTCAVTIVAVDDRGQVYKHARGRRDAWTDSYALR